MCLCVCRRQHPMEWQWRWQPAVRRWRVRWALDIARELSFLPADHYETISRCRREVVNASNRRIDCQIHARQSDDYPDRLVETKRRMAVNPARAFAGTEGIVRGWPAHLNPLPQDHREQAQ